MRFEWDTRGTTGPSLLEPGGGSMSRVKKKPAKKKLAKEWKKKMPTVKASDYPRNDMERAVRFAKTFAGELKYVQAWKKWLLWDGVRWVPDEDGK